MAWVSEYVNDHVAHMAGVKKAVHDHGRAITTRARAKRAQHRDTGAARIYVVRQSPDYLVVLQDRYAVEIELGGIRRDGRVVKGLFIVSGAAGI